MATTPILSLPVAIGLDGTEWVPLVQAGVTSRVQTGTIANTATGFVPTSRVVTAGLGLSGGGTLASDITLSFAIDELTSVTDMTGTDAFVINQAATGLPRKVTFSGAMTALTSLPNLAIPNLANDYLVINHAADGLTYKISASGLSLATGNMPSGGTTGQILTKNSNTNYDTTWTSGGFLNQPATYVFSGPTSGPDASPAFRALVGTDLPNPGASSKGGVQSYAAVSNQFLTSISTSGVVASAQPSAANLSNGVTGSGTVVLATSPTLVTPALGTPSGGVLTNCTGLPIGTGVAGLGTGIATFLATPSSANLAAAITNETGSGSLGLATSPTLVTPLLGTPTSGTLTNCTGLPLTTGITGTLGVGNGGTGATAFTLYGVLYGNSSSAVQVTAAGSSGQVLGGNTAAAPSMRTMTAVFDDAFSSTQGSIIYRNVSAWTTIGPGTAGQVLSTNGPGANPTWLTVSGVGTVTSVDVSGGSTGLTFTGGPITGAGTITMAGTLDETFGGTGLTSYTQGDILYASAVNTLAKLAKDTNATRYLSNTGATNNPAWAQIALSTGVSGQLPLANGGTAANLTDPNADRIMFWDDSAGAVTWLTAGTGLTISETTLTVDIESGTFTPTVDFATLGNLTVSYTNQTGSYLRINDLVTVYVRCDFTPTYTTASGNLQLKGWPFSASPTLQGGCILGQLSGFTYPAGRTFPVGRFTAGDTMQFVAFGSAAASSPFTVTQCHSGTAQQLIMSFSYRR